MDIGLFTAWLVNYGDTFLEKLKAPIFFVIQSLIDMIPVFVTAVIELFSYACPPPPLSMSASAAIGAAGITGSAFIKTLNWLFPISFLVYYVHFIVCALTAYFTVMVIGRWTKIIT